MSAALWIWVVVAVVLVALACYLQGRDAQPEFLPALIIMGICWPVALGILAVVAPLWLLYRLGERQTRPNYTRDEVEQ